MGKLPFERREKTVLEKTAADTSPKYGKPPEKRTIPELLERGIVIIDKPAGPTSHQVSSYVKKILKLSKAGHSGTLDPAVTGVLPVAIGKGTRIVQSMLPAGKEYTCLLHMYLGWIGYMGEGIVDDSIALRHLFYYTKWRKQFYKKNSAELKRMQRMCYICGGIDKQMEHDKVNPATCRSDSLRQTVAKV